MRLAKLELNGFKSFARKTEIQFSDGITAVIGPNGSGKSNIADAIRWVLGEQSARTLRGAKMEDVIFNGTQQRKAQAYCEVTLTFDNSDGKLNVPFEEVAVTRRIYRSGESEYSINKNACRLRDIQDMFRDTGIGKDGYSIIGQGKVDEILSNRSNDRRAALEEAAGLMRYRVRKEEAERKLDHTEKNLLRIEDILEELGQRLGPLEEQSASARTYLRLRDELKDCEVNIFLYQHDRSIEKANAVKAAIEQMQAEQSVSQASEQALLEECAALEERVQSLDSALTEQQNKLLQMLSGVEKHVGESRVLTERREHAEKECARIRAEQAEYEQRLHALSETLDGMRGDDAKQAALTRLDADIEQKLVELSDMDAEVSHAEADLEDKKNSIIEAMNRASDVRSRLTRFEAMKAAIAERLSALDEEDARSDAASQKLADELKLSEQALAEQATLTAQAKADLDAAVANRLAVQTAFLKLQEEAQQAEQRISAAQSRLRVLQEMAKSREGYFASVKNIMKDAASEPRLSRAILGVVAELIDVPKDYETAISMALGSSMQNIVTPTAEDAQYVIEYLRSRDYGRATLLPLSILHANSLSATERGWLDAPGCLGVASELIDCDDSVRAAVEYLLGRTVIVKDLNSGIALKKRSRNAFHIATLDGDILSTGGSMSGGSLQKRSFSLLGREREMKELEATLSGLERKLTEQRAAQTEKERTLLQCDVQIDAFRNMLHAREMDATRQKEQRDIILRDAERAAERQNELRTEREQLNENIRDIEQERAAADEAQQSIELGNSTTRDDVTTAQQALGELRARREQINTELTDQKVRRMALAKEQDAWLTEQKRMQTELGELTAKLAARQKELDEHILAIDEIDQTLSGMLSGINLEQSAAATEKETQRKLEQERAALSEALSEQRARREQLLTDMRELTERLHRQELTLSRTEMELTNMQDHIWEEYALTYDNALSMRHDIAVGATNVRIGEIKAEILTLGDINLASIEDYKAVSERHATLGAQHEDLRNAKADLETLIVELTGTMREVFLKQFAIIQSNFTDVFTELFGGGHAELCLGDDKDVLGCDIDIIAQPPGKKLQLLSLLSGGERALTAIALLFALLKLKPPAFCLLDEIESSLDEVNVSRFANYIEGYRDDTQFILITHRKGSMEVCNVLYGVSMEEKGISKIVSARFGEVS